MACLILLSLTWIPHSQTIFGKNCLSYMEQIYISAPPIIPKLMTKLKLSTSVWKHICGVLHLIDNISVLSGYP
jgi:hypothetical protein